KIKNGVLLVNINGDKYQPINLIEYSHCQYERLHFYVDRRLKDVKNIKAVVYGEKDLSSFKSVKLLDLINTAKALNDEIQFGIQAGDYVEFTHFGDVIKGYIEEPHYVRNVEPQTETNIERTQYSHENSNANYVLK